jgi:hypothetical protein
MAKKTPKAAYVVFRGRKPGIYRSWDECNEQVAGFSKEKYLGFETFSQASLVWEEWQRKMAVKVTASAPPGNAGRPWAESLHPPTPWIEPPAQQQISNLARPADGNHIHPSLDPSQPSSSEPTPFYYDPPLPLPRMPGDSNTQRLAYDTIHNTIDQPLPQTPPTSSQNYIKPLLPSIQQLPILQGPAGHVDLRSPYPLPQHSINFKRSASYIDLTDGLEPSTKRLKSEVPELTVEEQYELDQLKRREVQTRVQEVKIELSPEQEKVVNMALRKNNIFLTGAAGCGKTVTLKEILARLNKKKKGGNYQVVAPTGISALPLDGKTTYSFAGVRDLSPNPER